MASSKQTNSARGVAILGRSPGLKAGRQLVDLYGRWAILECLVGKATFTLCTLYGSNLDEDKVLDHLNGELASWPTPLILCGYLNINLRRDIATIRRLDYKGRKPRVFSALKRLVLDHGLVDVWPLLYEHDPGFTFFSFPRTKLVRLDYFFF